MRKTPSSNGPFSRRYFQQKVDHTTTYKGIPIIKCPFDLWSYQEIIYATKPTLIVETGTFCGASALFLADYLDALGDESGRVLSVDIAPQPELPEHPRVEYLIGMSSTAAPAIEAVRESCRGERVMVILDSDHTQGHVLGELNLYAPLVSQGCYLIVEDTNADAYPTGGYKECGPLLALKSWQPTNRGFEVDRRPERFGFTANVGGYLRKVR